MAPKPRLFARRPRLFSTTLLGCACATLPLYSSHAQTNVSAPVGSTGLNIIETSGVYPTGGGAQNHYIDTGAAGNFPSFAVLDFSAGGFGLSYPVNSVSNLTLALTESQYAGSKAGVFNIYLSESTSVAITSLKYMTSSGPSGLGTQLGDSSSLFNIGSFTSNGSTTGASTDTFTLALSGTAQSYLISQLNSSSGDLRLVIASNDAAGYASFLGNLVGTVPTANQPTLSFSAVLNQPTLTWTPGGSGNANGGAGTWQPAGTPNDTSWNGGSWNSSDTAQFSGTGGQVAIGAGGVSATGIQINATGYTLGTTTGPAITLTSSNGTTAPSVQVTNANDMATINAPVAGTVGLNKTGAGTLVLGGANTYMGGTTITAGTLQIATDANLGDTSGGVTLAGGTFHPTATLVTTRAFGGSGAVQIDSGNTLTTSGVANFTALTLPGAGTAVLLNTGASLANQASNAVGTVTFNTGGATLTASSGGSPSDGQGIISLGGITAGQTSGIVTLAANSLVNGTVTLSVPNAGATLNLPGGFATTAAAGTATPTATLVKTGAGTLVLSGNNSNLTGTTTFRQGTAGATPASGGVVSITNTVAPGSALGSGEFDANGGTISNDSGQAITLTSSNISVGAQNAASTPGGLVFAGANGITVTGAVSLYRGGAAAYQHTITVNTPTVFTGVLSTTSATAPQMGGAVSLGLTFAGTSTLTLQGTAANTINVPITIATTGANTGVTAAANGTFAATPALTINAGANLTINTGAMGGTVNTINDGALLTFATNAGAFGKIMLTIGLTGQETVGGLYLAAAVGTLPAGYLPAGTYGSSMSNATYKDDTLFSGPGMIMNLNAVPEPSTWAALLLGGLGGLGWLGKRRRAQRG